MPKIVPIVEGQGEFEAVPKLLNKVLNEMGRYEFTVALPKNAKGRGNLDKPGGLEGFIELSWCERDCGATLILMDADKECAVTLAHSYAQRVEAMSLRYPVMIVIAQSEYEAWFLASLPTIAGKKWQDQIGLPSDAEYTEDSEALVGVKGWLSRQLPAGRSYKPAQDQVVLTAMLDLELTRKNSRSFRRLCHAVEEAVKAIDRGAVIVTPVPIG